jgi:basic membrane protein A
LVTDVLGIHDNGMNQYTWVGLEEARSNGLIDRADYIESVDARDYEKNIAYFAEKGYDVIVTTNMGPQDETLRGADLYPDSVFIGMNQPQEESRPNLVSITFPEDQMGFAAGALAARISETQVVGAVCETSGIDSMWRYCEGFRAGVVFVNQFINRNVKALVIYRDNGDSEKLFVDEAWGHETALGLIQRGADVIFATGGATGQGALKAANELRVESVGSERDQGAALRESGSSVVTSLLGAANLEVQKALRMVKEGNIQKVEPGQIQYVPFDKKFPENWTQEMDTLLLALQNGDVKTKISLTKP